MSIIFRLGDTIKKKIHALVGTKIKGSYQTTVIGIPSRRGFHNHTL